MPVNFNNKSDTVPDHIKIKYKWIAEALKEVILGKDS